jgi:hypothetical protein
LPDGAVGHQDPHIHLAVDDLVLKEGLFILLHLDLYRRKGAAKAAERLRQVVTRHQCGHADGESSLILLGHRFEGVARLGHGAENAAGVEQKLVALSGESDAARVALE